MRFVLEILFSIRLFITLIGSISKLIFFVLFPTSLLISIVMSILLVASVLLTIYESQVISRFIFQQQSEYQLQQEALLSSIEFWEDIHKSTPSKQTTYNLYVLYTQAEELDKAEAMLSELKKIDPLLQTFTIAPSLE